MKKQNYPLVIILLAQLFLFEGCFFGPLNWNWNGSGSGYNSPTQIDQSKLYSQNAYVEDKPFKMTDGINQSPMMSQAGQVNANLNLINGKGVSLAVAVSKNIYVQAGANILGSDESESKRASIPSITITHNTWGNDTIYGISNINYTLKSELDINSFYVAIGRYHTFHEYGRFEYCFGYNHGHSKNLYTYDFNFYRDYSFSESRDFNRFYLQSDFGFVKKHIEGAITLKASCYNFNKRNFEKDIEIPGYDMKATEYALEPSFMLGIGGTWRGYISCGWSIPLGNNQVQYTVANVQAGMIFRIKDKSMK